MKAKNYGVNAALAGLVVISLLTLPVLAEDREFAGKWKGEMKAAGGPGGGAPGGPGAGGPGGRGGFGGRGGGFGGGFGGAQKITLNLKQSKDNKVSGNITVGESGNTEDVKEGKVVGMTITFKSGKSPQPVYEYYGELKGEELVLMRNFSGSKTPPQQMVLTKK